MTRAQKTPAITTERKNSKIEIKYIIVITVLLLLGCKDFIKVMSHIDENISSISQEDSKLIDSMFIDFDGNRPGATVMIAKGNKVLFFKTYGLMNIDKQTRPTSTTQYHLASTSKQFTAMAILKLIDDGKLSFSSTMQDVFPGYPGFGKSITIQHLLTHQSGIPEINKLPNTDRNRLISDQDRLIQSMKIDSLQFAPGTKYTYSNTGFSILAAIVSKVSGMAFEDYMQKEIFDPEGMSTTGYYPNAKKPNVGYHILEDTIKLANGSADINMGSGSVYTSMKDYFKWHLALCHESIVSSELHQLAYTPQEGTKNQWGTYGYGWNTNEKKGVQYAEHGGVTQSCGFVTFTARIPKEKITVAIFTNRAWTRANIPSQNIGNRAKVLLSIASDRKFPMMSLSEIDPEPKKSLAQAFFDDLLQNGRESAKILFESKKDSNKYYLSEAEMNNVGYALLKMERVVDAIEAFKLNVQLHPGSWNVYGSLAEAYMLNGNKMEAIWNYGKSLQLNPNNKNAIDHLRKINKE